ncbi:MAG: hypothetical protein BGO61_13080 [Thiobacillus sp. 65-69]|nr:DsrE family protein [Thiobacillus sp.]OJW38508.1 MAG: hypothetical protein BGO61_13080 [Thiobacillus sp. 65-69]
MLALLRASLLLFVLLGMSFHAHADKTGPVPFVMQMTVGDSDAQRRAFLQIQKVMQDIGPTKVKIEVVAYESGITSLLADNKDTATLVAALSREGVRFTACRISMRGHKLKEAAFPVEVEFVPAGAPEMISLQIKGYRYWRP